MSASNSRNDLPRCINLLMMEEFMCIPEIKRITTHPMILEIIQEYLDHDPIVVYDYQDPDTDHIDSLHTMFGEERFSGWSAREVVCCNLFFRIFDRLRFGSHFLTKQMINELMRPYQLAVSSCSEILERHKDHHNADQLKHALQFVIDYSVDKINTNNRPRSVVLDRQTLPDAEHAIKVFVRDAATHSMFLYGICFYGTLSKLTNIAFKPKVKTTKESVTKWCTSPKLVVPTDPFWKPFQ